MKKLFLTLALTLLCCSAAFAQKKALSDEQLASGVLPEGILNTRPAPTSAALV